VIYRVQAYNTAHDSENKIHDDTVARRFGFTGALVPGVDVYAYMMHLPVARWGREFLERGASECKFTSPVYDGETVEVIGREDGIEVISKGKCCATGWAKLSERPVPGAYVVASPPGMESRPEASPKTLAPGTVLGTQMLDASS